MSKHMPEDLFDDEKLMVEQELKALDAHVDSTVLSDLITWAHCPDLDQLDGVLIRLTDLDLTYAMLSHPDTAVSRLAWMELGARHCGYEFDVKITQTEGGAGVVFTAPAKPLHTQPATDVKLHEDR